MQPILDALHQPALAESAADVIGVAAANNPKFQTDLLELAPDIFETLMKVRHRSALGLLRPVAVPHWMHASVLLAAPVGEALDV